MQFYFVMIEFYCWNYYGWHFRVTAVQNIYIAKLQVFLQWGNLHVIAFYENLAQQKEHLELSHIILRQVCKIFFQFHWNPNDIWMPVHNCGIMERAPTFAHQALTSCCLHFLCLLWKFAQILSVACHNNT